MAENCNPLSISITKDLSNFLDRESKELHLSKSAIVQEELYRRKNRKKNIAGEQLALTLLLMSIGVTLWFFSMVLLSTTDLIFMPLMSLALVALIFGYISFFLIYRKRKRSGIMKTKKIDKKKVLGCSAITTMIAVFVAVTLVTSNSSPEVQSIASRKTVLVPLGAPPGTNETGLDYVKIVPHQADPGTAFASEWSGTTYETSTELNEEMTGTTPFNTPVDVLYKIQINWSDGYNISSGDWDLDYAYFLLTCADLGISANTNLTEIKIGNNDDEMWVHYYENNGGAGYQLSHNQKVNLTSEKLYVLR